MARHRTPEEKERLRAEAAAMRSQGVPRAEICRRLGIGEVLAQELLRGVPVPDALRRPNAKDELRLVARALRGRRFVPRAAA